MTSTPSVMTILFMAADPSQKTQLRLMEEAREIRDEIERSRYRDLFRFEDRMAVRVRDIGRALHHTDAPRIVHFAGHGTYEGLQVEDAKGNAASVKPEALAALFATFADEIACVVLNACFAEPQAQAISQHVPYVVGTTGALDDRAAVAFAIGFYQALGGKRSIEQAFHSAIAQIQMENLPGHLRPVLYRKGQPPIGGGYDTNP